MPPADRPAAPARVVVWRLGDALLAVDVDRVVEIAPVDPDGRARSRLGALTLAVPPGLAAPARPQRAVVLRTSRGPVGAPADAVEGVHECAPGTVGAPPAWLAGLSEAGVRALVRLDDRRIAALLEPDALVAAP